MEKYSSDSRWNCRFLAVLMAVVLFRMWFASTLPLSGDEAYHWEWSRSPAFGYYDHPGLTAYLIRLSTAVMGGSTEFSVRFPAILLLSAAAWFMYLLGRDAGRDSGMAPGEAGKAGFAAGLLVITVPLYAFFSVYISTDPPLICFWAAALYWYYRAMSEDRLVSWVCAGVALGLALMSKFLAFMLVPPIGLFVLFSRKDRALLLRPGPYISALTALAVWSPFLWWNYTHDWATFRFNFVARQTHNVFTLKYLPEFLGGQALVLSPVIFGVAVYAVVKALREGVRRQNRPMLYLGLAGAITPLWFLMVSLRRRVGIHWPEGGWLAGLALTALLWYGPAGVSAAAKRIRAAAAVLCLLLTVSMHLLVHIPPSWLSGQWRYGGDPGRINTMKQDERFGWSEMGEWVGGVRDEMLAVQGMSRRGVFLITGQYGLSSMLSFYIPGQTRAHLWAPRRTHGENYRFWDDFGALKSMDAVFMAKRKDQIDAARATLERHFNFVGETEAHAVVRDGRTVRTFFLARCFVFNGEAPVFGD